MSVNKCRDIHIVSKAHQDLCIPSQQLLEYEMDKRVCSVREAAQVSQHSELVGLVGEKAVVNCVLGGKVVTKALWDTGAMVSMVDKDWLALNFPEEKPLQFLSSWREMIFIFLQQIIVFWQLRVWLYFDLGSVQHLWLFHLWYLVISLVIPS